MRTILCIALHSCCYNYPKTASISHNFGKAIIRQEDLYRRFVNYLLHGAIWCNDINFYSIVIAYLSLGSSAQPVSTVLQVLLDKYQLRPSQVDCQIQQTHIPYLAAFFDNVGFYVDVMELTPGEQTDVKGAEANQLAVIKCLKLWKGKNPARATFMTLLEMLVKLRKEEIVDQICQYLKVSKICQYYLKVTLCVHSITITPVLQ